MVRELPLSGGEHPYVHKPWTRFKVANNCYAYAFHDLRSWRPQKSVPGDRSGGINSNFTKCRGVARKIVADNPKKVYIARATTKCKKGYYKVMMVVAPKDRWGGRGGDFHFYKQHGVIKYKLRKGNTPQSLAKFFGVGVQTISRAMGLKPRIGKIIVFRCNLFSHKMGWATGPLLVDSAGKVIKDPRKAKRTYGLDYSKYCKSFCVRGGRKGPKVGVV